MDSQCTASRALVLVESKELGPNVRATSHAPNMYFTAYFTLKVKLIEWLFIPGGDASMLTV